MWNFLAREANWTEIIANTLALGFSLMAIVVIGYAVLFDPGSLAAVSSVTSGITGVILGFYFNRERLKSAQSQANAAAIEKRAASEQARESEQQLERLSASFARFVLELDQIERSSGIEEEEQNHDA